MRNLLIIGIAVVMSASFAKAEEFDLGVETDMAFADSESALAAEEEAARRAQDEKLRASQEKEIAKRETEKARQLEATAKSQMAKWAVDEKRFNDERKEAEKRKLAAQATLAKIQTNLTAREAELTALTELVDQTVAERDKYETAIEKTNDRINQIEIKMKQQAQRKARAEHDKTKLARHLQERRAHLKNISRKPASAKTAAKPGAKPVPKAAPAK